MVLQGAILHSHVRSRECTSWSVLDPVPLLWFVTAEAQGAIPTAAHQLPRVRRRGGEVQGLNVRCMASEDFKDVPCLDGPHIDGILPA